MARIDGKANLSATVTIELSESEAGALDALAGYGTDEFLKVFYEKMGAAYLKPYEAGLRSLFSSIRDGNCGVEAVILRAREAREVFYGKKIAVEKSI